jgi:thiamine biosynthesis lipoprotein
MSNWTENSEVARVNREAADSELVVHPEVCRVIASAMTVAEQSDGAFDITVEPLVRAWGFLRGTPRVPKPREIDRALELTGRDKLRFDPGTCTLRFSRAGVCIDLGGIAKGYGVDAVSALLRARGVSDALVDLSGNMVATGDALTHEGWTVGIRDPSGEREYLALLRLFDQAIATSGDYEQFVDEAGMRYGHILDPRTGYSVRGLSSVTVVSDAAMSCDAWATALFVLGPDRARELARERDDMAVVLIEPGQSGEVIWVEDVLRDRFRLADGVEATVRYF